MLLLKRYGLPVIIVAVVYTIIYFLCKGQYAYFNSGLIVCLAYAFLMRFTDDVLDYKIDLEKNKIIFKFKILIVFAIMATLIIIILSLVFDTLFLLIPLVCIAMMFLLKGWLVDIAKPFFMPFIVISLCLTNFELNIKIYILAIVLFVVDLAIILFKRSKQKNDFSK